MLPGRAQGVLLFRLPRRKSTEVILPLYRLGVISRLLRCYFNVCTLQSWQGRQNPDTTPIASLRVYACSLDWPFQPILDSRLLFGPTFHFL